MRAQRHSGTCRGPLRVPQHQGLLLGVPRLGPLLDGAVERPLLPVLPVLPLGALALNLRLAALLVGPRSCLGQLPFQRGLLRRQRPLLLRQLLVLVDQDDQRQLRLLQLVSQPLVVPGEPLLLLVPAWRRARKQRVGLRGGAVT